VKSYRPFTPEQTYLLPPSPNEWLPKGHPTVAHDGISPETQFADLRHEPDPARKAERARLGLLGRIAATLCLIEVYGHAPSAEEFRACLAKRGTRGRCPGAPPVISRPSR
jgi:hypothetical protein